MFTKGFGKFVCDGDRITCEVDGFHVMATVHHDPDMGEPWKEHDGHGIVSEWERRDKAPGERVLATDRGDRKRFYDVQATMKKAKAEGWDAPPYKTGTRAARAARAVERDFKSMKAWCDDEWTWCGVAVKVSRNNILLTGKYEHALWGIELNHPDGDNDYLMEVANDLIDDALDSARAKMARLCVCADEDNRRL